MTDRVAVLAGWGADAPDRIVTNSELENSLDTTDAWITSRTGIHERRWADPGTSTGDMAVRAGRMAMRRAGVTRVDRVVLATTTPDHTCPATAPWVAHQLGLGTVPAYDVAAVCSGFLYALAGAREAVLAGSADTVLVIGADRFTSIVDPADRSTAVIFGDGAGAVVIRAGTPGQAGTLGDVVLGADGSQSDHIMVRAGGARQPLAPSTPHGDRYFAMRGPEVFSAAVSRMANAAATALDRSGWTTKECDWLVAHQANWRILAAVGRAIGIDEDRVVCDLDRFGNTSAASIPMALAHHAAGFRAGDRLVLAAFGGGTTWGATTLTWPEQTGRPPAATDRTEALPKLTR
jgi:3-oxoacyl-[acyl-carrier-protein] synthase-3